MYYDFSKTLHTMQADLQEFINLYTACVDNGQNEELSSVTKIYENIFAMFHTKFKTEDMIVLFEKLAHHKMNNGIPHTIVSNEIYSLKGLLIKNMNGEDVSRNIKHIFTLFQDITNRVSYLYLMEYIEVLIHSNNIRLSSISDLVEKNIILHYEAHLEWLINLARHIKNEDKINFPELDKKCCSFGKWLHNEGRGLIQNKSKFTNLERIHSRLHLFGAKIYNIIEKKEYYALITYLEKCELISLGIGTELALLDHIIMNKTVTKDTMTGALNRNTLRNVFRNQYELSLATNNSFILAMCDLDFFKQVNDTYGHIAGDKLLKLFVDLVKKLTRNSDVVVRYGGEEFVIMLPAISKERGYQVLNEIREKFSQAILDFNDEKITATVSIGMIEIIPKYLFQKSFIEKYLMEVDEKLYLAKESGRNRVES